MNKRIKKMITMVLITVLFLQTASCSIRQEKPEGKEASDNRERGGFQEQEGSVEKEAASGQGQEGSAGKEAASGQGQEGFAGKHIAGGATEEGEEAASAAAYHLLELWSDYLELLDQMYGSALWAFDYVDAYLESSDWADLTKARTACIASARFLDSLSAAGEDLSEEEYLALAGAGIDTGYQSAVLSGAADLLDDTHREVRDMVLESLENGIFQQSSIEILKEIVSLSQDFIAVICRYCCNEANYLLLTLGEYIDTGKYWQAMREGYPTLFAADTQWLASEDEVMAAADQNLDAYEEMVSRQAGLTSQLEAALYDMVRMEAECDLQALRSDMHPMTNMPELLPVPVWYNPEDMKYLSFVQGENKEITYPASGDELADEEYGMYIETEGIRRESMGAYVEYAKQYAADVWEGEEQEDVWYIRMPDYYVKISLEGDTATMIFHKEDITFAPTWYLEEFLERY